MRKDGRDFDGWVDTGGIYGTETITLDDGQTLTVFPLLNPVSERFFLLTNPEGWFMRYRGLLLTLNKRWSDHWQGLISYSRSRVTGLQASSGVGAGGGQVSSSPFRGFGQDPNGLINADGRLPDDRPHMFRIQATGEIPGIGVRLGVNFQYLTGKPWAATTNVRLPQGRGRVFVEPRGSRHLPSQSLLDLRVSKVFRFRERGSLELLVDVLNLLDDTATENVRSINIDSRNFAEESRYIDPRRAMLGIKVAF